MNFVQKVVILVTWIGIMTIAWVVLSSPFHTVTSSVNGSVSIPEVATQHTRGNQIFNMGYVVAVVGSILWFLASCAKREYETQWRRY